jgi:16S rRNA (guanine527-N7)-methyltransferase
VDFITEACGKLGIGNVKAVHGRAEDLAREPAFREGFDLCVSRAVAPLPVLLEYCLPFVRVGGYFFAYKTRGAEAEIEDSKMAFRLLGAAPEIKTIYPEKTPENTALSGHCIMIVEKKRTTPKTYPRQAGVPKKVPL